MLCTSLKLLHCFTDWDIYLHKFFPRDWFSLPLLPIPPFYSTDYMSPIQFIRIHQIIILVDRDIRRGGQASGGVGSAKVFS